MLMPSLRRGSSKLGFGVSPLQSLHGNLGIKGEVAIDMNWKIRKFEVRLIGAFFLMKKVWGLPVAFLLLGFIASAHAQPNGGPNSEFMWDESQPYTVLDKVRFSNGQFIQVAEGKVTGQSYIQPVREECEYKRLEVRNGNSGSLQYISGACDGIVHIRAAYPDEKNAKLAIVTTNCGGTMCSTWNDHYIVFLADSGIRVTRVGTSFYGPKNKITKYGFSFDGQRLSRSSVINFYDGTENDLGDLLPSTRIFVKQDGYVDVRFDKKFLRFVGEHPDTVLGDEQVRASVVQKIKPERFRAFRTAMSGPGSSHVHNGRFLVMNGCMKSNCPWEFGTVVLDGFTGALNVVRFAPDENVFDHASSVPLKNDVDGVWLGEVDTQQKFRLSIEGGRLRATRKR